MNLDPRIKELLADITSLSDEELQELRDLIVSAVDGMSSDPTKVIGESELSTLEALAASAESVTSEESRRKQAGVRASAARSSIANLVPADRRPRFTTGGATAVTAAGAPINDRTGLAEEIITAVRQQRSPGRDGRTLIASVRSAGNHPVLRSTDSPERVAEALTAGANALVAAGGLGGKVEDADYALPGFESMERPVKSALAVFTTDRGGIRFMQSPTLADLEDAIGVWDLATDVAAALPATPAGANNTPPAFNPPRKNIARVTGTAEVTVNTQAITSRLLVGNLMSRAYPELVGRYIDLASVAHARVAERELIDSLDALSTQVTATGSMGAARVLLPTLDRAAVAMRDRLRAAPDASVTVVMPSWVKGLLRSDLAMQEPGDATLGVTDAELAAFFATRNIVPVYSLDTQNYGAQSAGALLGWASSIKVWLHLTGSFVFMDGGTLDLGLVRDTASNAANDYELFTETFEALVQRVPASLAVTVPVAATGVAAA